MGTGMVLTSLTACWSKPLQLDTWQEMQQEELEDIVQWQDEQAVELQEIGRRQDEQRIKLQEFVLLQKAAVGTGDLNCLESGAELKMKECLLNMALQLVNSTSEDRTARQNTCSLVRLAICAPVVMSTMGVCLSTLPADITDSEDVLAYLTDCYSVVAAAEMFNDFCSTCLSKICDNLIELMKQKIKNVKVRHWEPYCDIIKPQNFV